LTEFASLYTLAQSLWRLAFTSSVFERKWVQITGRLFRVIAEFRHGNCNVWTPASTSSRLEGSYQQILKQLAKSTKRNASKVYFLRYPRNSPYFRKPKSL